MAGYSGESTTLGGVPRKVGAVACEVERQISSVCALEKCLEELADRLSPILSNHPVPATTSRLEASQEPPCPLAHGLSANTSRIDSFANRVREIIGRVEL